MRDFRDTHLPRQLVCGRQFALQRVLYNDSAVVSMFIFMIVVIIIIIVVVVVVVVLRVRQSYGGWTLTVESSLRAIVVLE